VYIIRPRGDFHTTLSAIHMTQYRIMRYSVALGKYNTETVGKYINSVTVGK